MKRLCRRKLEGKIFFSIISKIGVPVFIKDLFAHALKRQKGEKKLKRRANLAGNLGSKLYPQPFTPPSLITRIQTTFVVSL